MRLSMLNMFPDFRSGTTKSAKLSMGIFELCRGRYLGILRRPCATTTKYRISDEAARLCKVTQLFQFGKGAKLGKTDVRE